MTSVVFHSEELHVTERLRRPSTNYFEYPWTSAWRRYSLSVNDEDLTENFCTNNQQVEQLRKLIEVEQSGGIQR